MVIWDAGSLPELWAGVRIVQEHHSTLLVGAWVFCTVRLKIRLEFTSAQKFGTWIMVQWRYSIILWRLNWGATYTGLWNLDHSEPHLPHLWNGDKIVYVNAVFEMLSRWKLLLLFAKSECSLLFMAHKPGWLLESFVGVGGGGRGIGKIQISSLTPDLLNQNFSERT